MENSNLNPTITQSFMKKNEEINKKNEEITYQYNQILKN